MEGPSCTVAFYSYSRRDNHQRTALRFAIEYNNPEAIKVLIQHGASLENAEDSDYARDKFEQNLNRTSTQEAIAKGKVLLSL